MTAFLIFFLWCMIVFFPVVRRFLPQRDEAWMLDLSRKKGAIVLYIRDTLEEHNSYFKRLSTEGKKKFVKRIMFLMVRKVVVGYQDLKVSREMAILALSAQVQITFGLKKFSMPRFKKIILYPQEFYSRYFERNLKGLTSGRGFVTLSWKDTLEGYANDRDNLNLALHEFAHALYIDLIDDSSKDNAIRVLFNQEGDRLLNYFEHLKNSNSTYLRKYAYTNEHEFFAVCIEHFFESPLEFQKKLGELYRYFCKLLNQDPLNIHRDYAYA